MSPIAVECVLDTEEFSPPTTANFAGFVTELAEPTAKEAVPSLVRVSPKDAEDCPLTVLVEPLTIPVVLLTIFEEPNTAELFPVTLCDAPAAMFSVPVATVIPFPNTALKPESN